MVLDVRVVTFFEEQDNIDEQVDELQWGQTQRIVFSFTNPSNATVIRLDNITAYFLDTESGQAVEIMEPMQLDGHMLDPLSTYSLAYQFKVFGGLKDQKKYTFQMELNS